ncbi:Dolichyl-diphosphooligosaccharide-protein glycosyltransferase subunit 2 [Auxenochlorella protothecoides]|uniref:Dolichyl-diphosphooligosaccharide-protein glycosyltransferase subunit 2 n=1 Tax=Auxenochlorella protothecoides TaxID=3075 RepID=A0A087SGU4_AUXPR|nr:Dolichyl-diphosphooligosaccharide-protein glycosyltransferase subunit 2 [Auxenochlorella protothecoides]KFM24948.1 Dolichyl-diphosphooligosaccharide-protein glycosyltransferase subunit 2 [Auxenochlorella protothecoides]RMZ52617.1 hypothetical protein APUTEX25_000736 [Auxenochlorella protothecoides]|eukprot:RMZ52617.1 hypothetical protein APUTEX25_000736 [Auxenochlorella protothecoides]
MALLFLHIQSVLSVSDIHLTVEDGEGVVLASHTILRGATLEDALTLEKGCSLKASFKPVLGSQSTMFLPQQAFLRVDSPSGTATVAVAARPSKAGDALIATAGHSALAAQLAPGPTRLSLVLGDASLPLGLEAVLGTLVLGQPAPGRGYKAPVLGPLPEIQHRHRQPERRANPLAPLTALGGVLALGAAFLLALPARLGANLKGFPAGGRAGLAALGFHAALAATLGTLALFWLRLTLLQTLPALGALGLVVNGTGRALAATRAPAAGGRKKAE